jgi:hypothetical protein
MEDIINPRALDPLTSRCAHPRARGAVARRVVSIDNGEVDARAPPHDGDAGGRRDPPDRPVGDFATSRDMRPIPDDTVRDFPDDVVQRRPERQGGARDPRVVREPRAAAALTSRTSSYRRSDGRSSVVLGDVITRESSRWPTTRTTAWFRCAPASFRRCVKPPRAGTAALTIEYREWFASRRRPITGARRGAHVNRRTAHRVAGATGRSLF